MTRVEFIINYGEQPFGAVEQIIAEDRDKLSEYGAIVGERRVGEGQATYIYTVEFETEDGWEAYEQAQETAQGLTLDSVSMRKVESG